MANWDMDDLSTIEGLDSFLSNWIAQQCKRKGFTRAGLAKFAGMEATVPSKITRGGRHLKASEFELAKRYFRADPFSGDYGGRPAAEVRVAEFGAYRDVASLDRKIDLTLPSLITAEAGCLVFVVRGDGLAELKPRPIFDGDFVVCKGAPPDIGSLATGNLVVLDRRASASLDIWERSVRQVREIGRGIEFSCHGRNVEKKPYVLEHGDPADEIRIVALVDAIISAA